MENQRANVLCPYCNQNIESDLYELHTLLCLVNHTRLVTFSLRAAMSNNEIVSNSNLNQYAMLGNWLDRQEQTVSERVVLYQLPVRYTWVVDDDYEMNMMVSELMGNVEVGLTKEDIDRVSVLESLEDKADGTCPICLDEFTENPENTIRKLLCGHRYCDTCITTWLSKHKKCPCCQVDLEDAYLKI